MEKFQILKSIKVNSFLTFVVVDLFNNSVLYVPLLIYEITQEKTREFFFLFSQSYDLTVVSIPAEKIAHNKLTWVSYVYYVWQLHGGTSTYHLPTILKQNDTPLYTTSILNSLPYLDNLLAFNAVSSFLRHIVFDSSSTDSKVFKWKM